MMHFPRLLLAALMTGSSAPVWADCKSIGFDANGNPQYDCSGPAVGSGGTTQPGTPPVGQAPKNPFGSSTTPRPQGAPALSYDTFKSKFAHADPNTYSILNRFLPKGVPLFPGNCGGSTEDKERCLQERYARYLKMWDGLDPKSRGELAAALYAMRHNMGQKPIDLSAPVPILREAQKQAPIYIPVDYKLKNPLDDATPKKNHPTDMYTRDAKGNIVSMGGKPFSSIDTGPEIPISKLFENTGVIGIPAAVILGAGILQAGGAGIMALDAAMGGGMLGTVVGTTVETGAGAAATIKGFELAQRVHNEDTAEQRAFKEGWNFRNVSQIKKFEVPSPR